MRYFSILIPQDTSQIIKTNLSTFVAEISLDMDRCRCCCLVVKSCLTLCDPMDQSTPGPPVFHCLPDLGQIHVGSFGEGPKRADFLFFLTLSALGPSAVFPGYIT